jgi:glycosyltransferase involved in cell wall biosynthesis
MFESFISGLVKSGLVSDINIINGFELRIAILTNYWYNSRGGGLKTYLFGLTEGLKNNGINPYVVFREGYDPGNYKINGSKYIYPIKSLFVLRKIRPNVIHSQGSWFCILSGYLWKQLNGSRLVCTIHTVTDNPNFIEKIVMKFLIARCDAVTFVSKHLEKQTLRVYKIENLKSYITHAGVTARSVSEEEIKDFKAKYNINNGKILILGQALTAHRVKAEGAKLLIMSVKKLTLAHPNILLILTREGPYTSELREFTEMQSMSDYVVFTGDLDNPFIVLKACDILAHITLDDAFPITILEAMSMGMPIVASAVGGIQEIINEQNGQLIDNNSNEIAKAIEYFLVNKDIAQTKGKIAQQDAGRFGWDETIQTFISLYMPCCSESYIVGNKGN